MYETNPEFFSAAQPGFKKHRTCNIGDRGEGYWHFPFAGDSDFPVFRIPNKPWNNFDEKPRLEMCSVLEFFFGDSRPTKILVDGMLTDFK
jgi:hypothetical protein